MQQLKCLQRKLKIGIRLTEKKVEASSSSSAFGRDRACLKSRRAINCQEVLIKMLRTKLVIKWTVDSGTRYS